MPPLDPIRQTWLDTNSHSGAEYPLELLVERKGRERVSVVLPAREVAGTIERVLDELEPLRAAGLIDESLVVDAASADGTAQRAAARGALVAQESELLPELGPALGKGDALWRGLSATTGSIVAFADCDSEDFVAGFVSGILGPLLCDGELDFVKGHFHRPMRVGASVDPRGGGRVTELVARPFLALHRPELAVFAQPLAGEMAGRRAALEAIPFPVGYGVEIAMLLDLHERLGLRRLAQVDLGTRQNRHQDLRDLGAMALAVLLAAERRCLGLPQPPAESIELLQPTGNQRRRRDVATLERPPLAAFRAATAAV